MNPCNNRILKIKVFGILKEELKSNTLRIPISNNSISLEELTEYLKKLYPYLYMNNIKFVFAVNKTVCNENVNISPSDEIALIPPISGG
jgi:molybdopterin converting factor small subunit